MVVCVPFGMPVGSQRRDGIRSRQHAASEAIGPPSVVLCAGGRLEYIRYVVRQ